MSRKDFFARRRLRRGKGTVGGRRLSRPTQARVTSRPDGDLPGRSAGDGAETSEQTRTRAELLEIITAELRTSWAAAQQVGAGPEELRRLLEKRRKTLEHRSNGPDG